jgi:anhydro-N-acetylmuramic acid kinase
VGDRRVRGTLQMGEAARIGERLRVPVVSDFRQQDIAAGGQGAPLVPFLDYLLFADPHESRAIQNLGGIGNVTYLRAGASLEQVIAFDTGPANAMIDAAAEMTSGGKLKFDESGRYAAAAEPCSELVSELLRDDYLQQAPPKSTGRELYSSSRVGLLWEAGYRGKQLVSTMTQFTVDSIADAYRKFLGPIDRVFLAGGGARNPELVRRLRAALSPTRVSLMEDLGLDAESKEAVTFAVMGYETLRGRPSNVPSATGASRAVVQGKITVFS